MKNFKKIKIYEVIVIIYRILTNFNISKFDIKKFCFKYIKFLKLDSKHKLDSDIKSFGPVSH